MEKTETAVSPSTEAPPPSTTPSKPRSYFVRTGDRVIAVNGRQVPFVPIGDDLSYYITDDPAIAAALREHYTARQLAGLEEVTKDEWAEKKRVAIERQFARDQQARSPLNQVRLQGKIDPFGQHNPAVPPGGAAAGRIPRLSTVVPDPRTAVQQKIARDTAQVAVAPPTSVVPKAELLTPGGSPDAVVSPQEAKATPSTPPLEPPKPPAKAQKAKPGKAAVKAADDEF